MKFVLLMSIITIILEVYKPQDRKNILFLVASLGCSLLFKMMEMPEVCLLYFSLYLAYLIAYRDHIFPFALINIVTMFYFIFAQIFITTDVLAAALSLMMFINSKTKTLMHSLSEDDRTALATGLGALLMSVLTVVLQGVKVNVFIRFIFIAIELVLSFLLLFLVYLYEKSNKEMKAKLSNELKQRSIHIDSESAYLNKIQHDLRYAITLHDQSGTALRKVAAEIDAHLLSSASDLIYLLKSRAADHHKDLILSAPKNLSLTDEQINAVLEFYEKVLEVGMKILM